MTGNLYLFHSKPDVLRCMIGIMEACCNTPIRFAPTSVITGDSADGDTCMHVYLTDAAQARSQASMLPISWYACLEGTYSFGES